MPKPGEVTDETMVCPVTVKTWHGSPVEFRHLLPKFQDAIIRDLSSVSGEARMRDALDNLVKKAKAYSRIVSRTDSEDGRELQEFSLALEIAEAAEGKEKS